MIKLVAVFILLHGPSGNDIRISPEQVTSLRAPTHGENFPKGTHCMVSLADGKFVAVLEPCDIVQHMMEKVR